MRPKSISHFFVKELAGEQPPSFATMESLYRLSSELLALSPWEALEEDELVLVKQPYSSDICYCSVMGAMQEVYSLHVYLGDDGYRTFQRLQEAEEQPTIGEFIEFHRSVSVEFVEKTHLEPEDRFFLKAMRHPLDRLQIGPMFRANRPGHYPWYVTETEAKILWDCMTAVINVCHMLEQDDDLELWQQPGLFPLWSSIDNSNHPDGRKYHVEMVPLSDPPPPTYAPAQLDEARVNRIRAMNLSPGGGAFDLGDFWGSFVIGEKNERKSCLRVAMAIDSQNCLAYKPAAGKPSTPVADLLAGAALNAIEDAKTMPSEIRVRQKQTKDALEPLAKELGVPIREVKSLPALERAKELLAEMLGEFEEDDSDF